MGSTSARRIAAQERRRKAVELRRAGASYRQIGQQLDMAKSSVHKTVNVALDELKRDQDDQARLLQVQESDRLDRLQFNLWTRAVGGDVTAIQTVLKIMERRARLLGLDAPTKVAPTSPDGNRPYHDGAMTDDELDARIAELEMKYRGGPPHGDEQR